MALRYLINISYASISDNIWTYVGLDVLVLNVESMLPDIDTDDGDGI